MVSFRLVGRVAFAAACLLVAVVCLEPSKAWLPVTQGTAGVDFWPPAIYLNSDDGVAVESGRLGAWLPGAAALFPVRYPSAEVPAPREQLSQLIPAPHELVQRVLRWKRQTSLSASTEAARSLSSAEVAQVQPGRRSPGLLVVAALLAGLLAVAGPINQISASRLPLAGPINQISASRLPPSPRSKIQWERMVSEPILATRLQPQRLPCVQLHRFVTEKSGIPTLGRRGASAGFTESFLINV
ncbi:unnamed protein product [Polarella glacialis]|uniref:Transmembrane protein n=1 Tax=Polarella glacialis TaxID=89957 RepID=A0A813EQ81_POLGL|nr:unnamed protein product [Polarella glacialis]